MTEFISNERNIGVCKIVRTQIIDGASPLCMTILKPLKIVLTNFRFFYVLKIHNSLYTLTETVIP